MKLLSVLVPTRGRPKRYRLMLESLRKTATGQVEILNYVDDDDSGYEYPFMTGPRIGTAAALIKLADKAQGDYLMLGSDDIRFDTVGWDRILQDALPPDGIGLAWAADGWKNAANHFVFGRKWFELTGLWPNVFRHFGPDTYMRKIAEKLKRAYFVPSVHIAHLHFRNSRADTDRTYIDARTKGESAQAGIALSTESPYIKRDLEILKEYIEGSGRRSGDRPDSEAGVIRQNAQA